MAVPELWRTTKQRYSLRAEICPHCEEAIFPPRALCPHCRREMKMRVAPAAPVREFVYAMPLNTVPLNGVSLNAASLNGAQLVVAGDD